MRLQPSIQTSEPTQLATKSSNSYAPAIVEGDANFGDDSERTQSRAERIQEFPSCRDLGGKMYINATECESAA